jgi:taurine dioxygenase
MTTNTRFLTVEPLTEVVGALVTGVDLTEALTADVVAQIRQALLDRHVVFLRGQDITRDQLHAFASAFGTPIPEPFRPADRDTEVVVEMALVRPKGHADIWHYDTTFMAEPPLGAVLRAVRLPSVGGDTLWSSMYAAYDALSEPIRSMLDGLTAVHSVEPVVARMGAAARGYADYAASVYGAENVHPVVRVHPETGRKALFVNEAWTIRIVELTKAESDKLLSLLFEHVKLPDFSMRWHWAVNDVAIWDNRAAMHYAVADYNEERVMQRVALSGDGQRPVGPPPHGRPRDAG